MNKSYRYDLLGRSYHIGTSRRQVLKLGPINLRGYPTEFRSLSTLKMLYVCTNVYVCVHEFFWGKSS